MMAKSVNSHKTTASEDPFTSIAIVLPVARRVYLYMFSVARLSGERPITNHASVLLVAKSVLRICPLKVDFVENLLSQNMHKKIRPP